MRVLFRPLAAIAVVAALCLVGNPARAGAPVCSWDVGSRTLTMNIGGLGIIDSVAVGQVPDSNELGYRTVGDWVPCPSGTVNSADLLVVNGTLRSDEVALVLPDGVLRPGHTQEAKGASELEVELALGAGTDTAELRGGPSADSFQLRSTTKAAINGDNDADVTFESVFEFHLNGGGGTDSLNATGARARLTGGNGDDALVGSPFDDDLCGDCGSGTGGTDLMLAGGGSDQLSGGAGVDIYDGGDGSDVLRSGPGADVMVGGDGADVFGTGNSPDGADIIKGGKGWDAISYESRPAAILVTQDKAANDGQSGEKDKVNVEVEEIVGTAFDDEILGSSSDQHLSGLDGNDLLNGGNGDDVFEAGPGDDVVEGDDGDDTLVDEAGYDEYLGGDDRDTFESELSGGYDDTYRGGIGVDTMDYSVRTEAMEIDVTTADGDGVDDESDDVRPDIEVLIGGDGADRIIGGSVANTIYGLGSVDALYGGDGPDTLFGGDGDDSLDGQEGSDWLYGEGGYDSLFGADGAADQLACGVDGGESQQFDDALDTVSNCDVPL